MKNIVKIKNDELIIEMNDSKFIDGIESVIRGLEDSENFEYAKKLNLFAEKKQLTYECMDILVLYFEINLNDDTFRLFDSIFFNMISLHGMAHKEAFRVTEDECSKHYGLLKLMHEYFSWNANEIIFIGEVA